MNNVSNKSQAFLFQLLSFNLIDLVVWQKENKTKYEIKGALRAIHEYETT